MDHANTPERLCPAAETLSQFPGSPATVRDEHHIDPASPQCKIAPSRESSLRLIPVGTGEKVTTMNPAIPTPERVDAAIQKFDHDNELAEQALKELFRQYPGNGDLRHVLLKIAAVNSLCQTCIFAMDAVARHIHAHHEEIDSSLAAGSIEAVDKIAKVTVKGKVYNFFTKGSSIGFSACSTIMNWFWDSRIVAGAMARLRVKNEGTVVVEGTSRF